MNKATQIANRILETRGYVVGGFIEGPLPLPKVGDVWRQAIDGGGTTGNVAGPFLVIAEATAEEYIEQAQTFMGDATAARKRSKRCTVFVKLVAE